MFCFVFYIEKGKTGQAETYDDQAACEIWLVGELRLEFHQKCLEWQQLFLNNLYTSSWNVKLHEHNEKQYLKDTTSKTNSQICVVKMSLLRELLI